MKIQLKDQIQTLNLAIQYQQHNPTAVLALRYINWTDGLNSGKFPLQYHLDVIYFIISIFLRIIKARILAN